MLKASNAPEPQPANDSDNKAAAVKQWWSAHVQRALAAHSVVHKNNNARTVTVNGWTDLDSEGSSIGWWPGLLAGDQDVAMQELMQECKLEQLSVTIFGKSHPQRRLIAYCAAPGLSYTYSGLTLTPQKVGPRLRAIQTRVEGLVSESFNACLLNLYRSGDDQLGWHADNERMNGPEPTIVSVSLGSRRDFLLRRNADHTDQVRLSLGCGDVMAMRGRTQLHWQHSVPKTAKLAGPRLNLTFRRIENPGARGLIRQLPPLQLPQQQQQQKQPQTQQQLLQPRRPPPPTSLPVRRSSRISSSGSGNIGNASSPSLLTTASEDAKRRAAAKPSACSDSVDLSQRVEHDGGRVPRSSVDLSQVELDGGPETRSAAVGTHQHNTHDRGPVPLAGDGCSSPPQRTSFTFAQTAKRSRSPSSSDGGDGGGLWRAPPSSGGGGWWPRLGDAARRPQAGRALPPDGGRDEGTRGDGGALRVCAPRLTLVSIEASPSPSDHEKVAWLRELRAVAAEGPLLEHLASALLACDVPLASPVTSSPSRHAVASTVAPACSTVPPSCSAGGVPPSSFGNGVVPPSSVASDAVLPTRCARVGPPARVGSRIWGMLTGLRTVAMEHALEQDPTATITTVSTASAEGVPLASENAAAPRSPDGAQDSSGSPARRLRRRCWGPELASAAAAHPVEGAASKAGAV